MATSPVAADPDPAMQMFLEVRSGPQRGRKIRLNPGFPVRIGRTNAADVFFTDDSHMSGLHFAVEAINGECRISDLNSRNGSWLNGQRIANAILTASDTFIAGETKFGLLHESAAEVSREIAASSEPTAEITVPLPPQPQTAPGRLLEVLRNDFDHLYVILDSARDIRILALLLHHKQEQIQSLYEGEQGATLAQVAPYLVRLAKDSPLLEILANEGWGKSWGIYLTATADFQQVRHHLRHFLQVKLPNGEQVYFRFYDPRVMRVFLPTCTPQDATEFFGPIENYLVEDESPNQLLRFVNTGQGSQKMMIQLLEETPSTEGYEKPQPKPPQDPILETETWHEKPPKDQAS